MTEPWATAHVDAELDFGNLDDELVRRLELAAQRATQKVGKQLDKLVVAAERRFRKVSGAWDSEMKVVTRRTQIAVIAINRQLSKIERQIRVEVDVRMTGAAVAEVRAMRNALSRLRNESGQITSNVSVATSGASPSDLRALGSALRRIQANSGNIALRIDVQINSLAEVTELRAALRSLPSRQNIDVNVDVDRRGRGMKALKSLSGLGGMLSNAGKSALGALGSFAKLTAIAGSAVVALGGMMPVLAGVGAALGTAAGAGGFAAAAGLFAVVAAGAALKTAFSGISDVTKNMFDPEKADKFEEALAKLTPSAQSAMRAVQGLGKQYADIVKKPVQEAMFAGLAPKLAQLGRLMPAIRDSLVGVAEGFNDGANGALRMINSTAGMSMVKGLLADSGRMAGNLGAGLMGSIPGFLAVGASATKVFAPMTDAISGIGHRWSESMLQMQQDGTLEQKIQGMVGVARQLGQVLAQVGSIIGGVFRAASAAGDGNPMANMLGSLTQVSEWVNGPGQQALTSFFQSMGQAMGAIMPIVLQIAGIIGGTVAPMIAQLITSVGPALQTVVGALGQGFAALQPAIAPLGAAISAIGAALAPILPVLGQLIAQFVQFAGPILGSLAQALSPILTALGQSLIAAFKALQPAIAPIQQVFEALSPVLTQVAQLFGQYWSIVGGLIAQLVSGLAPVLTTIADVFGQVLTAVSPLLPILGDALGQIIELIAPMIQQMAEAWAQVVTALLPLLPPLMQIVQALLPPLIQIIGALLPLLTVAAQVFAALVPAIAPLVVIVAQVVAFFAKLLGGILSFVATALGAIVGFVTGVITGFANMVATVISTVTGWVSSILGFFGDLASSAMQTAGELWSGVSNAFSTGVTNAVNFVKELPGKVLAALSGAGKWLLDVGKDMIRGFIEGIKSMGGLIADALREILPDWVEKFVPGLSGGGFLPGFASGGALMGMLGGGEITGATTSVRPGGFIVNAKQTRKNRDLLQRIAPRGRVLSGPGTGTSDSITGKFGGRGVARLSTGEFYAPPEAVSGMLPLFMAINAGRQLGSMLALGGILPAFAPGGMIPSELRDRARQAVQSGYVWGGWGNGWNTDCSGLTSSLANMATGKARGPGEGERTATGGMRAFLSARGFADGKGPDGSLRIGWSGTHAGAQLPTGENVEHTGPQGSPAKFGADAKDPAALGEMMHLPMGGDPSSSALGPDSLTTTGSSGSTGTSSSTPIGSGIKSSGGSPSWGNSGGASVFNSAADAKRGGLTPVWVENWPASMGGASGSGLSTSSPSTTRSLTTGAGTRGSKDLKKGASKQDMMDAVYRIGKAKGMSDEEILAAGETLLAESDGKNYANSTVAGSTNRPHDAVGSDGKSLGVMQQQSGMGWGSDEQLMDPEYAIGRFYDEMKKNPGSGPAHQRAQAVQRSAFSDGSNYLAKKDEAAKLLANAKNNQVPVTSNGNVPVEVKKDNTSTSLTTPTPGMTTTAPGTKTTQRPMSEGMVYGRARADQWSREQDFTGQVQTIGIDASKEILGEFGDLIGLKPFVDRGIDQMVAYLKQIAEKNPKAEFKWAEVVNINGGTPGETKQKTTEGMTAVMDTYRQG